VDETYRMLGREHEADLEREALRRRRAAEAAEGLIRRKRGPRPRLESVVARLAALVGRDARLEG
jgi:hypothetical protein